jgi:hypothetical protein
MTQESGTSIAPASSSAEAVPPAPVADDQKPGAAPASGAEVQNTEPAADTPEQVAAKAESRRARSNARKAQALADARAEAKLLREEVERLRTQPKSAPASDEPKRENFETLEDYYDARAQFRAKQETAKAFKERDEAQQGRDRQQRDVERNAELAKQWTQREREFQKTVKDYDEVVARFADEEMDDLHQAARTAIVESEHGPALLYHLATDTSGIVERISGLSPTRQIAELGKLETQLQKPVKPSNAPPPTTPIAQGRAGQSDPNKMTDAEYRAYRKSQGARWAQN